MKTITYLDILCEAISAVTSVNRMIRDSETHENWDAARLSVDEYLAVAYVSDTARKLFDEMPEGLASKLTEERGDDLPICEVQGFFYLLKHKVEGLDSEDGDREPYNMRSFCKTCHTLHSFAHDLYTEGLEAVKLYT